MPELDRGLSAVRELFEIDSGPSMTQRMASAIEGAIVSGALKPGYHLGEVALAKCCGVSRTPVREAVRLLVEGGWIRSVPYAGSFVSSPTFRQMRDTFELRRGVEELTLELSVGRAEASDICDLSEIVSQGVSALGAMDIAKMARLNSTFHIRVAQTTGNELIVGLMRRMQRRIEWQFRGVAESLGEVSWQEHREMVLAIEDRDAKRACALARKHVERTQAVFFEKWPDRQSDTESDRLIVRSEARTTHGLDRIALTNFG